MVILIIKLEINIGWIMIKTKRGNEMFDGKGEIDDYVSDEDEFSIKETKKYRLNQDELASESY